MTLAEITDFVLGYFDSLEKDCQRIIDASLPNKQQHTAAAIMLQDRFHTTGAYIESKLDERE